MTTAPKGKLRPGDRTPVSGQFPVLGPRGRETGAEVTSVKGHPMPPTPKPGQSFGQPDVTKHPKRGS